MRPEEKNGGAGCGCRKRQTPGLRERDRIDLSDHRKEAAGACSFLERPKHVVVAGSVDEKKVLRIEPEAAQSSAMGDAELAPHAGRLAPEDGGSGCCPGNLRKLPEECEKIGRRGRSGSMVHA